MVNGTAATAQAPAARERAIPGLIPAEQFSLPNGLKVVFHIDRSDPVVAVSLNAHVGSARELPGRTGFAHLFEHLFFLESEISAKAGSTR
jgi:zinc protease